MPKDKKRYTIGVLVGGIMDDFTRYVCRGVMQQAKLIDANVVIFPGKYIERDLSDNPELMYEYQYGTVFSYARKNNIDALIIAAGSIGCFATTDQIKKMLKQYEGIPCLLVATEIEGYVSAIFDNYQGIKDGMEYLIKNSGCRHFGMIGGTDENLDSYERKQAFQKILEDNGLPFEEKMVVKGDLSRRCTDAFKKLLDDNSDLDAIFCVNDETAIGMYEELKQRGIQIGKDISVLGYDDTISAAKASPSLSSVRADSSKLGEEAVKMALRIIRGEKVENIRVSTSFVRRDSFKHPEQDVDDRQRTGDLIDSSFTDIFYRYQYEGMSQTMNSLKVAYNKLIKSIQSNFDSGESTISAYMDITVNTDDFIRLGGIEYADVDNLLSFLERLYRSLKEKQPDDKKRFELRDVFSIIYRKIVRDLNGQIGNMQKEQYNENYSMKIFIQELLQFEKGRDQSYSVLLENLDWLHIKNATLYMLEQPVLHLFREEYLPPEEMYLKAVLKDGEVSSIPAIKQKCSLGKLFYDGEEQLSEARFEKVIFPLFFHENVYGVLTCDMSDSLYNNGEFLVNQVSAAVKMIALLQVNEGIQQQLEENLVTLKENNIELDTISKIDVLTGILNRRGFYKEAGSKINKCRVEGKNVLVIYIDMNNLKIINDRFGHEEGDFSLKLIGQFLGELVRDKGIAGRIGGDEYACVLEYDGLDQGKKIVNNLNFKFEEFNRLSDKPYIITVSAGAYLLDIDDPLSLEEALSQADERLYEVKQFRKKEVVKALK